MIIKQFRYYDEANYRQLNQPSNITVEQLQSGEPFFGIICDEIKIKTLPGVSIVVNGTNVLIGETGIYEIPYREKVQITNLKVTAGLDLISNNPKAYFIVTFIQNEG